jgi:RNA polymerase sigma-70 factor, ECF subfamily
MFDYSGALRACAQGDRAALQALYIQEAGRLAAVAQRIVRRKDLAEEVVQEAFIQIWRKAQSYDPELGSARSWIYAVVRNRALNVIRDGSREDLLDGAELAQLSDARMPGDDAFQKLSQESRLRHCLEALDAQKRACILLSYVQGYSHGEIAGNLGIPIGTAKSWVRRGLIALKDCMA